MTRHINETIAIDDVIRITIVEIRGDRVMLGIDAPKDVAVHREEVWDAIQREKEGDGIPKVSNSP